MIYRNTLLALLALAVPAALTGLILGAAWGWGVLAVGLFMFLLWHARHLSRLQNWLAHPLPGKVPEGQGIWDEVLAALHRLERDAAKREESLADALARMRRAVQALPDGVVILDSANRIEWYNRTAEAQLGLEGRADIGQNIANLVRDPEFIEYLENRKKIPFASPAIRVSRSRCSSSPSASRRGCSCRATSPMPSGSTSCGAISSPTCRTSCARR